MKLSFLQCGVIFLLMCSGAVSGANEIPSVIYVDLSTDTEGNLNRYLDLDYGLDSGQRILFSISGSRSSQQDNPITTNSLLLGWQTNPLERVNGGVEFERRGNKDFLLSEIFRATIDVGMDAWLLSFRPQWSTITFTTNCGLNNCRPEETVNSTGFAVDVIFFTQGSWSFSAGYASYQYDRRVEALAQYPIFQRIFSAATLDLAAGLEDSRSHFGLSYVDRDSIWSLSRLNSIAKVGGDENIVTTLRYSTELNDHWRMRVRLGSQTNADRTYRLRFAGAGLAYSW